MESVHGFDFFRLKFDASGKLQEAQTFEELKQRANAAGATDAVLIAHGFRNDENDATGLYTRFLETFRQNLSRPELQPSLGSRKFIVAGIYWPSKAFKEASGGDEGSVQGLDDGETVQKELVREQLEELQADEDLSPEQRESLDRAIQLLDEVKGSDEAQDELVDNVLSVLDGADIDATEGLDEIRAKPGSELLAALRSPIILSTAADEEDDGGIAGVGAVFVPDEDGATQGVGSFFGSIFGRIGQFLNLTTWYQMKNRSGIVGAKGVAQAVRDLKASRPGLKIHLVGHSLGGRLMAACVKSLATPKLQPDSVTLLQAAFSHYGFSPDNGHGKAGFFRAVMQDQVVRGPLVATFSKLDTVVGKVYAVASRLAGDNTEAVGDANDPFGGIGRNGSQKTEEAVKDFLHEVGQPYNFTTARVTNLDGSANLITSHGDVTNPRVTYAFASAVAQT
ncbi:MAG TPA: hypothetical protein VKM72_34800 [Thermoanaerobaculia bacterium]|nr:hypothetical protein [Thermoanaerobaculia bacterium]